MSSNTCVTFWSLSLPTHGRFCESARLSPEAQAVAQEAVAVALESQGNTSSGPAGHSVELTFDEVEMEGYGPFKEHSVSRRPRWRYGTVIKTPVLNMRSSKPFW